MNTNSSATVNIKAAIAAMAISLLIAVLFGTPAGAISEAPDGSAFSLQVMGR